MKARPRFVERRVAEELSELFAPIGMTKVERLPVIGRTGPDIAINESELVIDVKSRKCVPTYLLPAAQTLVVVGSLAIFRLEELLNIPTSETTQVPSKQISDWYAHMDEWTQKHRPNGISAIILHRPRMPIGNCGVVIHYENLRRLSCNLTKTTN
jgi:hypothetical protein